MFENNGSREILIFWALFGPFVISTRNHSNGSLLAPLPQMIDKRDCWRRLLIALRFDLRMLSRCYRRILTAVAH